MEPTTRKTRSASTAVVRTGTLTQRGSPFKNRRDRRIPHAMDNRPQTTARSSQKKENEVPIPA